MFDSIEIERGEAALLILPSGEIEFPFDNHPTDAASLTAVRVLVLFENPDLIAAVDARREQQEAEADMRLAHGCLGTPH